VLIDHHAQNRPNKPLSAERLLCIAKDQLGITDEEDKEDDLNNSGSNNEADEGEEDEDEEDEGKDVPMKKMCHS